MTLHPTTPVLTDGVDPRHWVTDLVQHGAVLQETGGTPCLVGDLRWLSDTVIGWFPAFGDRTDDARVLTFERVVADGNQAVFLANGTPVAELCPLAAARVADPEDYEIGWRLWLEVVPLRHALMEAAFEQLIRSTPGLAYSNPPFA